MIKRASNKKSIKQTSLVVAQFDIFTRTIDFVFYDGKNVWV